MIANCESLDEAEGLIQTLINANYTDFHELGYLDTI